MVGREAKATKKYLDHLFAAGGRKRLFDVEEFDAVAIAVRMPSITFGTLPGVIENLSQSKEAVVAAQTASAFLQLAAKNFKANAGSFADAES